MSEYLTFWRFYFVVLGCYTIGIGFRIYDGVASVEEISSSIVAFGFWGAFGLIRTLILKLNQ